MVKYELIESHLLYLYKDYIMPDIYEMLEECDDIVDKGFLAIGAYEDEDNNPVGAAVYDQGMDEVINLISIYVADAYRRQKIGTNLIHLAFSAISEDEKSKDVIERRDQNTFTCAYRMKESESEEFDAFMAELGVLDFINLPDGATFRIDELFDNPRLHNAVYGAYELPEDTYLLNDLVMEMNVYIRDLTSVEADGSLSFVTLDDDDNMYCSVIEQRDDSYYRLHVYAGGEDMESMYRAFEATLNEMCSMDSFDEVMIDISFHNAFIYAFFKELNVRNYDKMVHSQAVMVVEFGKQ